MKKLVLLLLLLIIASTVSNPLKPRKSKGSGSSWKRKASSVMKNADKMSTVLVTEESEMMDLPRWVSPHYDMFKRWIKFLLWDTSDDEKELRGDDNNGQWIGNSGIHFDWENNI